jgi:hypothetical protein
MGPCKYSQGLLKLYNYLIIVVCSIICSYVEHLMITHMLKYGTPGGRRESFLTQFNLANR